MSKHKMVDGRLLQMNKSYGQLKQKQKEKISEWMYQAYRKQTSENLSDEEALQLIFVMENILDKATQKMDALEKKIEEYEAFQPEIRKLEAYYTSQQWKDDYAMDEAGTFPDKLKRGVLSQDGIWNLLERNKELTRRLGISEVQGHDEHE